MNSPPTRQEPVWKSTSGPETSRPAPNIGTPVRQLKNSLPKLGDRKRLAPGECRQVWHVLTAVGDLCPRRRRSGPIYAGRMGRRDE